MARMDSKRKYLSTSWSSIIDHPNFLPYTCNWINQLSNSHKWLRCWSSSHCRRWRNHRRVTPKAPSIVLGWQAHTTMAASSYFNKRRMRPCSEPTPLGMRPYIQGAIFHTWRRGLFTPRATGSLVESRQAQSGDWSLWEDPSNRCTVKLCKACVKKFNSLVV